jgi:hypothetical protein
MPFDELYHKEKRLVDSVIKATEALKAKEESLPDPMGAENVQSTRIEWEIHLIRLYH